MTTLVASKEAEQDLLLISPSHIDPNRTTYREGYESFFESMPVMNQHDRFLEQKAGLSKAIMQSLAERIVQDGWLAEKAQSHGNFSRTIVGMEAPAVRDIETPSVEGKLIKEGAEFVVAHWGQGFMSPIHGHATGYMHEEVLNGRFKVNTYRMLGAKSNKVRLVDTQIVSKGTFVSEYATPGNYAFKRPALIHNFVALEPTNSLHYLPEHVRDGRDNGFEAEYFEDVFTSHGREPQAVKRCRWAEVVETGRCCTGTFSECA